jgi:hypothetical protein
MLVYRPKPGRGVGGKKPLKCTHPAAARPAILRNIAGPKACVAPVIEYASAVWHDPLRDKIYLRHLRTI